MSFTIHVCGRCGFADAKPGRHYRLDAAHLPCRGVMEPMEVVPVAERDEAHELLREFTDVGVHGDDRQMELLGLVRRASELLERTR